MKLLVLLILVIAVTAIHLEEETVDLAINIPIKGFCKELLKDSVGYQRGKLVTGDYTLRNYDRTCS
jgi:hypothetical protein